MKVSMSDETFQPARARTPSVPRATTKAAPIVTSGIIAARGAR